MLGSESIIADFVKEVFGNPNTPLAQAQNSKPNHGQVDQEEAFGEKYDNKKCGGNAQWTCCNEFNNPEQEKFWVGFFDCAWLGSFLDMCDYRVCCAPDDAGWPNADCPDILRQPVWPPVRSFGFPEGGFFPRVGGVAVP